MRTGRLVYLIASSAPPVLRLAELLHLLNSRGWKTCVIATPVAASWIDTCSLAESSGFAVRVYPRLPHEQDPLPAADAILAAPLTFNSLNKWAAGHSDTLALGLLNEAIGLNLPVVAAPCVKAALRKHPAYAESIARLSSCGVRFLDPDRITVRPEDGPVTFDWNGLADALDAATGKGGNPR